MELSMHEHYLTVNGLRLRVLEWGDPAAPPMVLLHGFSSTAIVWQNVAEALESRFHLVAIDQRGHGLSDWDPAGHYAIDDFVADAHAVAQALHLAPFVLVGHSMGGSIAYTYAAVHPEDVTRLVIEDAAPRPADDPRPPMGPLAENPVFADREAVAASVREANPHMAQAALERRVDVYYTEQDNGTWRFRADVAGVRTALAKRVGYEWLWANLRKIQCPILLIRAGQEPAAISPQAVAQLEAANPRLRIVTVPDAGHNVHFAHFAEFMPLFEPFVSSPAAVG
jgi:pimeloyl-ACP methyl ester carboxylesterase